MGRTVMRSAVGTARTVINHYGDEVLKVFEVKPVPTPPAEEQPGETG